MSQTPWFVYIIESQLGKLYTGISTDPQRRFLEHQGVGKAKGAKFFRGDPPMRILWQLAFDGRSQASKEEARIKKLSRQKKQELIAQSTSPEAPVSAAE